MICRDCNQTFTTAPNKPGYVNQCWDCAVDVEIYRAEQGTEDSGVVETLTKKTFDRAVIKEVDLT